MHLLDLVSDGTIRYSRHGSSGGEGGGRRRRKEVGEGGRRWEREEGGWREWREAQVTC